MTIDIRCALLRTTAIAAFACGGAGAAFATSNGVTVNGGGSTLAGATYENIYADVGLNAVPAAHGSSTCPANGSTKKYDIFFGFVGSGAGASGFINNDSTRIGCAGNGLLDDFGAGDLPVANNYTNGSTVFKSNYGYQMIQLPAFGTPVAMALNVKGARANGSINLTDAQLCQIFSGAITSWSSIPGSGSTAGIEVAYRQDSSGTSFLTTNHLGAVCGSVNTNGITFSGTTKFATLFPGYTTTVSNGVTYYLVPSGTFASDASGIGSGGVQLSVDTTPNSIGYLSPDYTMIAPKPVLDANGNAPVVAKVNGILPNFAQTNAALKTISTSGTSATNPDSFGFLDPNPTAGYPIVGYTYIYISPCYLNASKVTVIKDWLDGLYNVNGTDTAAYSDITNGGFVPVPGTQASATPVGFAKTIVKDYLAGNATVKITSDGNVYTGNMVCSNGR
jgi:ABC-type phosphate transport system substrate-binding protein